MNFDVFCLKPSFLYYNVDLSFKLVKIKLIRVFFFSLTLREKI